VVLSLSVQVPILLEKKGTPSRHFVLIDESGEFETSVVRKLEEQNQKQSAAPQRRLFYRIPAPAVGGNLAETAQEIRPYLRGDRKITVDGRSAKLDAAILIPKAITNQVVRTGAAESSREQPAVQFWSANLADKTLRNLVENAINDEIRKREYIARGLDLALYQQITEMRLPVVELNPKKEAGQERVTAAEAITHWAPVGFVYLLWIAIFSISQMLLSNTIEEKSNRIIEVLLSSLTPAEFVLGKLSGIAAVGLTMIGAWLVSIFIIMGWTAGGQSEVGMQVLTLLKRSNLLPCFVVYFLFGYLLYAGIILAIGSVCNTIKEAQNYMAVVTLMMMVPLMTMMFIAKDPNGVVARTLSWVPLYTPFVMMNRAAASPAWWELIGTMLVLVLTTIGFLWAAVRIFRVSILRTGQPPRIVELFQMLHS
jgi:ABC-2 type transport system permease protein